MPWVHKGWLCPAQTNLLASHPAGPAPPSRPAVRRPTRPARGVSGFWIRPVKSVELGLEPAMPEISCARVTVEGLHQATDRVLEGRPSLRLPRFGEHGESGGPLEHRLHVRFHAIRLRQDQIVGHGENGEECPACRHRTGDVAELRDYRPVACRCFDLVCREDDASFPKLSNPKPGHTAGGSGRSARRSGRAGSDKIGCQQDYSPRKQKSIVPSKASKKRCFNVSPEARTSEIPCKQMEERNDRLTRGLSRGREALFVPGCRPVEQRLFVSVNPFHARHVRELWCSLLCL